MITNTFHFIYLYGDKTIEFNINHYISIKSNMVVNKADAVLWTNNNIRLRESPWIKKLFEEFPGRFAIFSTDEAYHHIKDEIGQDLSNLPYMAHCADMLRLWIMCEYGGAYSDVDSVAIHPIPEDWWYDEKATYCLETGSVDCLCNGFFLAPAGSMMLSDWLEGWRDYNPKECIPGTPSWTKYSVQLGGILMSKYKDWLRILEPKSFQPKYLTYKETCDIFYLDRISELEYNPGIYELHLWDTRNKDFMKVLDERYFLESDATYAQLGKKYL